MIQKKSDIDLLIGLASLNYLYRKLDAAHDLLSLAEHIEPNNLTVREFLAVLKFETRDYEQTYRIREGRNASNMADIKRIVNEDFIVSVMGRFKQMNSDFVKALTGAQDEDEDEFDVIL